LFAKFPLDPGVVNASAVGFMLKAAAFVENIGAIAIPAATINRLAQK
jgi:hypothetical protein